MIAEGMVGTLERLDMIAVGPVLSIAKAKELLEAGPALEAAILDVNLGGIPSFDVAGALEARVIPFLLATGYDPGDIPPRWRHVKTEVKPVSSAAFADLAKQGGSVRRGE